MAKNARKHSAKLTSPPLGSASPISAAATIAMLRMTCDWILLVNRSGVLLSVEHQSSDVGAMDFVPSIGQSCFDLITIESKRKLENMLKQALPDTPGAWRQLNHPQPDNDDVPVRYSTLALQDDRIVLLGQNMSDLADMQQRLLRAQQAIERDFAKFAQSKVRHQLVFDIASDALITVDANSLKISEANPAAERLLGQFIAPLKNNRFPSGFDAQSTAMIDALLQRAAQEGRAHDIAVRSEDGSASFLASASLIRDRSSSTFMVRLTPIGEHNGQSSGASTEAVFNAAVDQCPDAFIICDFEGRIVGANEAFASITQMPSIESVIGESIDRWLGRTALDQRLLATNVKEHGRLDKFSTVFMGEYGTSTDIEVSAAALSDARFPYMVLIARNIESRNVEKMPEDLLTPGAGASMTDLVGRVPLKELVRESTDLIEKMCIEAALELTSDNRASAAEMLGVSRQSLYVKLRRFGLAEQTPNG